MKRSLAGMTLVELLVGLALGLFLVAATVTVYVRARSAYEVSENVARLQERARYAIAVMEPDIEMAGYYGFTNAAEVIRLVRDGDPQAVIASAAEMRQFAEEDVPLPAPVAPLPGDAHACGVNFALDVLTPVQGSNGVFALGREAGESCRAYQTGPVAGADTLTLRRVETRESEPEAGRLQILASRLTSLSSQLMFADGIVPGVRDVHREIRNVVVRTYYVARDSVGRRGYPALRVKSLGRRNDGLAFDEDEVMPGIEDLQVQFGIARPDASAVIQRYVDPDFPDLGQYVVRAVRVWLRVRAEAPEPGYRDETTYRYADVTYVPGEAERQFRRALLSRTVMLRNAR